MEVRVGEGVHGYASEMGPQSLAVSPEETGAGGGVAHWGWPRLCGPGAKARG